MKKYYILSKLFKQSLYIFWSLYIFLSIIQKNPIHAQSLDSLLKLASKHSPMLKSEAYQTKMLKALHKKESIFTKNPIFSFAHQNIPLVSWPSLNKHAMSGINFGISQTLAFPWEGINRKKRAQKKYLSQKEQEIDRKYILKREITILFHKLHFLYEKMAILNKSKNSLKHITQVARSLVALNKMNGAQLLKLEADISKIDSRLFKIQAMLGSQKATMEMLCGHKIQWDANTSPKGTQSWLKKSSKISMPKKIQIIDHPVWKSMKLKVDQAEAHYAYTKAKLFPEINISAHYILRQERNAANTGEDFISLKASMPIPLYYSIKEKYEISGAKNALEKQKEDLKALHLFIKTSWEGEKENAFNILRSYENYEKEVLPRYFSAYQAHISFLPSGSVSLLDVLDAYRQYLEISLEHAWLFFELTQSLAKLNYLRLQ